MPISHQFLDELKDHIGLATVVGRRLRLQRKGQEYIGLCPFHNEKTPSFTINEYKGFFHCFGCGEHGSIFDFLMKIDNLTFPEAVERLAADAGMEMPVEISDEREKTKPTQRLYDILEITCAYYEKQLQLPTGKKALHYLMDRGITQESVKTFRLGFASGSPGGLKGELTRHGVSEKTMVEAGLFIVPDNRGSEPFERFRGRIMFPITDRKGRVIAFGGRILGNGEPKYLNSPETSLFQKGRNLYGLRQAFEVARKTGELIVTEGYTDVIALYQVGFETAVAPLGTALTEEQIQLLWRVVREPLLCFDGDVAGQRAAIRAAEKALPYLKPGYSLRFTILPEGHDPDSLIKSHGPEGMKKLLTITTTLSDVLWHLETKGYKLKTPEERSWLELRLRERAASIKDETVRRYYLNDFKDRLWEQFRRTQTQPHYKSRFNNLQPNQLAEKSGIDTQVDSKYLGEAILIHTLIAHPALFDDVGELLGTITFSDPDLDKLRQEVLKTLASSEESGERLEPKALEDYLSNSGCSAIVCGPLRRQVTNHASFARSDEHLEAARIGWKQQFRIFKREQLLTEIGATKERLKKDLNREDLELLKVLKQSVAEVEEEEPQFFEAVPGAKSSSAAA